MKSHDFILLFAAFISEVLGVLSGFGSSTFFLPIALLVESFKFVLILTAILHCFGNTFKIFLFRDGFDFHNFFRLAMPSLLLTGIGAYLSDQFSADWLTQALGVVLIIVSVVTFFIKPFHHEWPPGLAIGVTALSGFMTGLVGTGGALRGVALSALQIPKNSFVALSAGIDMGGDLLRAFIYLKNGYMDWDQWFYIPILALAAYLGARLGKKIIGHLNQNQFEKIVTVFVFLSGLMMLIKR